MKKNIAGVGLVLVVTYTFLIALTLFGVLGRNHVCENQNLVREKVTLEEILNSLKQSRDFSESMRNLLTKSSDEAIRKYNQCLNRSIFYLNGIGFFLGGLLLGFCLERANVIYYALVTPSAFGLVAKVEFFQDWVLGYLPDYLALPLLVSHSYVAILTYLTLSVVAAHLTYN